MRTANTTPGCPPGIRRFPAIISISICLQCLIAPLAALELPPGFQAPVIGASGEWREIVGLAFTPDGRLLVAEKRGVIHVIEKDVKLPVPFLDLESEVLGDEDRGLLGIAVDPDFAENGHVYLLYTVDPHADESESIGEPSFGRLTRYSADPANPNTADPASRLVLLGHGWQDGIPSLYHSHAVGCLRFGEDGSLLVSAGDGAHADGVDPGGRDPAGFVAGRFPSAEDIGAFRSQSIESLAGKILRVDPETGEGLASNPYYTGRGTDNASRVWAYGLRNPYRFCLRPGTGSPSLLSGNPGILYVADVGWTTWEEVDIVERGANLGWPCHEGFEAQEQYAAASPAHHGCRSIGTGDNPISPRPPLLSWHHTKPALSSPPGISGKCASAIAFYTGTEYPPEYRGACFIGEYDANWIKVAELDGAGQLVRLGDFASDVFGPVDIVADPISGDLHFISILRNAIYRLRYDPGNRPPLAVASSSPSPATGPAPLQVRFSSEGSMDPDGDPITIAWDFGDGAIATDPDPLHEYSSPGSYTATLTVSDGRGGLGSTAVETVVSDAGAVNEPPTAFILSPLHGAPYHPDAPVRFEGGATDLEDPLELLEFEWELNLHHNTHIHPGWRRLSGPEASLVLRNHDDGTGTWFEVVLRVKDTAGAVGIARAHIYPRSCAGLLDAGDPGTSATGTWRSSTAPFPHGSGSLQSNVAGSTYTYDFELPAPGPYRVYAWWTIAWDRTSEAAYTVEHAGGTTTVLVDQGDESAADMWNDLGVFDFDRAGRVTITAASSGSTCADAVCIFSEQGAIPHFSRGDTDGDGSLGLSDAIVTLIHLFQGGGPLPCAKAADANDDGVLNLTDPVHTLNYLFMSGAPPADPLECGVDPSVDDLGCEVPADC